MRKVVLLLVCSATLSLLGCGTMSSFSPNGDADYSASPCPANDPKQCAPM